MFELDSLECFIVIRNSVNVLVNVKLSHKEAQFMLATYDKDPILTQLRSI